jgi:hypothetical protein
MWLQVHAAQQQQQLQQQQPGASACTSGGAAQHRPATTTVVTTQNVTVLAAGVQHGPQKNVSSKACKDAFMPLLLAWDTV